MLILRHIIVVIWYIIIYGYTAGPGGVTRASFVAGALWEIRVGLRRSNFFMYRACLGMFAKSSGTGSLVGMSVPTDEHGLL
jgi:hypothetical protein